MRHYDRPTVIPHTSPPAEWMSAEAIRRERALISAPVDAVADAAFAAIRRIAALILPAGTPMETRTDDAGQLGAYRAVLVGADDSSYWDDERPLLALEAQPTEEGLVLVELAVAGGREALPVLRLTVPDPDAASLAVSTSAEVRALIAALARLVAGEAPAA